MKITVVGTGYVGLSNAALLAQKHNVTALDINNEKVELINNKLSPIKDKEIEYYLKNKPLTLKATTNSELALKDADYILICTPTNYDEDKNYFDTSSVENVIEEINKFKSNVTVVIKSTIPIGFTESINSKYPEMKIIFSPEFLREGKALYDNLYPTRIIVSEESQESVKFAEMIKDCALKEDIQILYTNPNEAECIKLFANTYLAMRVAFFNELDTFAEVKGLNAQDIIKGISLDPRIGDYYNNPSFGYGGYCLPKDTKQLLANFENIPQEIIKAIVHANDRRKSFISENIIAKNPKTVGIFRLTMKKDSDNFRQSAIHDIITELIKNKVEIIIYEPELHINKFEGIKLINDLNKFKKEADVIIANRLSSDLTDVIEKVYTRDIFSRD